MQEILIGLISILMADAVGGMFRLPEDFARRSLFMSGAI